MDNDPYKIDANTFEQFRVSVYNHFENQQKNFEKVGIALTEQSTLMRTLVGNGQPGRIQKLERSVSWVKKWVYFSMGIGAFLAFLGIEGIGWLLNHYNK